MQFLQTFAGLFANFGNLTWQMVVMWVIGGLLIYLAIAKKMEPSLLLPMGFGAILVNLPLSGAITQGTTVGPISALFDAGMSNELFPLLLFIGIGAMIDFGPLLEKPWLMLFGAAAQFGIFVTLVLAGLFFDLPDAASIAVIGAADGPTAIFVANTLGSKYLGAIMVAAYSYMALVPIVQPPVIRLCTTKKRAADSDAVPEGQRQQNHQNFVPDCGHYAGRACRARQCGAGRLPHVRQPAARVRRAERTVRDRAERTGEPYHDCAGPDRGGPDDRRQIRPARHTADPGAGSGRVYFLTPPAAFSSPSC